MRVAVVGAGAVGGRAARQLASTPGLDALVVADADLRRAGQVCASLGGVATAADPGSALAPGSGPYDVVLLAGPGRHHREQAERALELGASVVSCADDLTTAKALLGLGEEAAVRGRAVVVGAGFAPGLSCLLAVHAARLLEEVDEVHVARFGTGGPACARAHHAGLRGSALDWRDGAWESRAGGSGRELAWFPDPVAGQDCYRSSLPDALLLQPAFPALRRATARVAATRRDRLTAPLPMLRAPHPEGRLGAVRVEVRGRRGGAHETVVYGAVDRPAVAAGAVAAVAVAGLVDGRVGTVGAGGLATMATDPLALLADLAARGVRCAAFEGAA